MRQKYENYFCIIKLLNNLLFSPVLSSDEKHLFTLSTRTTDEKERTNVQGKKYLPWLQGSTGLSQEYLKYS